MGDVLRCPVCRKQPRDNVCGLVVYAETQCPVCQHTASPVVALPCGHTVCRDDYRGLGGRFPGDPEPPPRQDDSSSSSDDDSSVDFSFYLLGSPPNRRRDQNTGDQNAFEATRTRYSRVTGTPSAWVFPFNPNDSEEKQLRFVTTRAEYRVFDSVPIPGKSKLVGDGNDGLWVLHPKNSDSRGEDIWGLFHIGLYGVSKRELYQYQGDAEMVSDGHGGLFILCSTTVSYSVRREWRLWHVTERRERNLYGIPKGSKLSPDGLGGVWVFSPEYDYTSLVRWSLWRVNENHKRKLCNLPSQSKFVGDGVGGVWVLCPEIDSHARLWKLWHSDASGNKQVVSNVDDESDGYPPGSQLVSDGLGGLYVFCRTEDDDGSVYCLWYVTTESETKLYLYSEDASIAADGCGGVWVKTGGDHLWHANTSGEWNKYACSEHDQLFAPS